MAVGDGPISGALSPVAGSLRLIGWRVLTLVVSTAPMFLQTRAGLAHELGSVPSLARRSGPVPMEHFGDVFRAIPGSTAGALLLGVLVVWLFEQLLTAGAVVHFGSRRDQPVRIWRTVWDEGWLHLLPYLRVSAVTGASTLLGSAVLSKVLGAWYRSLDADGATGTALFIYVPVTGLVFFTVWLSLVGAWGLWTRVIIATDKRVCVRRAAWLALRVFVAQPLRTLLFSAGVMAGTQLLGLSLVVRHAPYGIFSLNLITWLIFVGLQAWMWHWLLRAACRMYTRTGLASLRRVPDEGFGLFRQRSELRVAE